MRKYILAFVFASAAALAAPGCVVRERPVAYHHVGPGPRYVRAPARRAYYEPARDDRGYREREIRVYP